MSSTTSVLSNKALLVAGLTAALDVVVLKDSVNNAIALGAAAAAGEFAGSYLGTLIPPILPDSAGGLYTGAGVQSRIAEVAGEYAAIMYLSKWMPQYGQSFNNQSMTSKLGLIVLSDIAATYFSEFLNGQPMSALS